MRKWPTSRWAQAGISFLGAAMASVCVFAYSNNSFFERYAREYPHDGQDGLGALMGALEAAAMTLMGVFLCLLLAQYLLTPDIKAKGERGGQAS